MDSYEITNMIIDDQFEGEESVTTDFTYNSKQYSITFNKSDLEVINSWFFEDGSSLPANLPDLIIDSLRDEVKKKI